MPLLDAIPVERREAANAALAAAFGSSAIGGVQPIGGGASGALVYRIDVASRAYLLRLETRRDAMRNPHQYTCMQIAADAGVAPPVRHVDDAAGVAIMDFLPQRPLEEYPGGLAALVRDLGQLAARLQATPLFPHLSDYKVILERLLAFLRTRLFAPGLLDPHAEGFARIQIAYPWGWSAAVSSHNDPNPRNIIFDGERLWLIDWETAYRNDPLVDVAILADNFARTPALEEELLKAWLGRSPDETLRARLVLMRQLTRLYYACITLAAFAAMPCTEPEADLTALSPLEFRAAVAGGRLKPGAPETAYALGKMCLAGFLTGLSSPEFGRALAVAGDSNEH